MCPFEDLGRGQVIGGENAIDFFGDRVEAFIDGQLANRRIRVEGNFQNDRFNAVFAKGSTISVLAQVLRVRARGQQGRSVAACVQQAPGGVVSGGFVVATNVRDPG